MEYFEGGIDYWEKEAAETQSDREEPSTSESHADKERGDKPQEFQWQKFLDPKNKEFFREGDYTPPEPFMELARSPTDHNIKMWFTYMEKKNELATRLSKRMEEYLRNNSMALPVEAKERITQRIHEIPVAADDFERFRFRMYFDSKCPHCQRMFGTLNSLQDRGYFVEARQVDQGNISGIRSNVQITQASGEEIKKFGVKAVPLLLIGDMHEKKVYRQSGFLTPDDILAQIRPKLAR